MASFLARALRLPTPRPADPFDGRMVLGLPSLVGYGGIAVMDGTRLPRTIIEDSVGEPRLSPDGEQIAYIDIRRQCPPDAQGPWDCYSRVFTTPFEGGFESQVTPNGVRPLGLDWTPDGDIAFFDWGGPDIRLATADPATGSVSYLTGPLSDDPAYLRWSARDILAVSSLVIEYDEFAAITLMTPDGEILGTIAEPARHVEGSAWSPDGSKLAYWSDGADGAELVVTDPDGGNRMVTTARDGWWVAWSPDGTRLAYLDLDDRPWCIEIAGGEPWPLAPTGTTFNAIDWG